jgi:hypothetical protein
VNPIEAGVVVDVCTLSRPMPHLVPVRILAGHQVACVKPDVSVIKRISDP